MPGGKYTMKKIKKDTKSIRRDLYRRTRKKSNKLKESITTETKKGTRNSTNNG